MGIEWSERLATGNNTIDLQHKELFRRFNDLLEACNKGKGHHEVGQLLEFLSSYVQSHFAAEEYLQKKHGYEGYEDHKKKHDDFIRDLQEIQTEFHAEGAGISVVIRTNKMLVNWLIKHISGTDKELASFLRTVE